MTPMLLQDFVTVRSAGSTPVIQSSTSWLDLGDFEDVALYLDVRDFSTANMTYETSASGLDTQFVSLLPNITMAVGVRTDLVVASMARIPPARFLRWKLQSATGGAFAATFRIWLAAYRWS